MSGRCPKVIKLADNSKDLYFRQFLREETGCLSYLIGDLLTGDALVVDPLEEMTELYVRIADEHALTINRALDTHSHADHYSGIQKISTVTGAALLMSEHAPAKFDFISLRDGETLSVGNIPAKVFFTPGHTPDHISLEVAGRLVLTGDSLFVGGVARPDLVLSEDEDVRSKASQLYDSIQALLKFEDYYELYPGHFAGSACGSGMGNKTSSTIGYERRFNGTVQRSTKEDFVDFVVGTTYKPIQDYRLIKQYNLGLIDSRPALTGTA